MKDNKLKKFWNDHKVAILIAGGTILSVAFVAVGIKRKVESQSLIESAATLTNAIVDDVAIDYSEGLIDEFVKQGIFSGMSKSYHDCQFLIGSENGRGRKNSGLYLFCTNSSSMPSNFKADFLIVDNFICTETGSVFESHVSVRTPLFIDRLTSPL